MADPIPLQALDDLKAFIRCIDLGVADASDFPRFEDQIRSLVLAGVKKFQDPDEVAQTAVRMHPYERIQAIKYFREQTGLGLKESKDRVEAEMARVHELSEEIANND